MNLLEKIKMLCSDRNMSVGDLEKELELGNGSIYKWNKSIPRVDTLLKVANYFGVDINYLLEEKEWRKLNSQYRITQTMELTISTDVFKGNINDIHIKDVEDMIVSSIMENYNTSVKNIKTVIVSVEDLTR